MEQQRAIIERLDEITIGEGHTFGADGHLLTIFPLHGERQGRLDYDTLEGALAAKTLVIAELEEPQVNALAVQNTGALPVLITDGDTLAGGRQHRVVNSTILLPPGRLTIPVSCVERGRWASESPSFAVSESAYPTLRREKSAQVDLALRAAGGHRADQGAIWREVAERQAASPHRSRTESVRDLYGERQDRLAAYTAALPYPRNAVGLIVGYHGRIVGLELFDHSATLAPRWGRLIRAAALDALAGAPAGALAASRAARMLRRPRKATAVPYPTPGLGADLRVAGGGIAGAGLRCDEVLVHLTLHRVRQSGE